MKYDIPEALQDLKPGAQWALRGDDLSGLEWLDSEQNHKTEILIRLLNLMQQNQ